MATLEDIERKNLEKVFGVSPEDADSRLDFMGFTKEYRERIKHKGLGSIGFFGSHEVRALIRIAEGSESRMLGEVVEEVRLEEETS